MRALDLSRPRSLSELLSTTFEIQREWFAVFFTVTALVNVPVVIFVDGVWGRQFENGPREGGPAMAQLTSFVLSFVVVGAIAALHVRIVERLSHGDEPTVPVALRTAGSAVGPAAQASVLSFLGVFGGFLLLVVPGVILYVRWVLAPQAAVVDARGSGDALRRSAALVSGRWWRVAGYLVVTWFAVAVLTGVPTQIIGWALDEPFLYVVSVALLGTVGASITALFSVLLFFSLRAEAIGERARIG